MVGVAYMPNATVHIDKNLTADHALAAGAVGFHTEAQIKVGS